MPRPLILVTNDDGIASPGLHALAGALGPLGEVVVVAPSYQQTSMGRALMRGPEGVRWERIDPPTLDAPYAAYAITASPALGVAYAMLALLPRLPDLCVSGINYGENIGAGITSSGTVGAALEASSFGVPALASALEVDARVADDGTYVDLRWDVAAQITTRLARVVLARGLPPEVAVLNINVPIAATLETPLRLAHQSTHNYYQWQQPEPVPGQPFPTLRKHVVVPPDAELDDDDEVAIFARAQQVAVTPLGIALHVPVERLPALRDVLGAAHA